MAGYPISVEQYHAYLARISELEGCMTEITDSFRQVARSMGMDHTVVVSFLKDVEAHRWWAKDMRRDLRNRVDLDNAMSKPSENLTHLLQAYE